MNYLFLWEALVCEIIKYFSLNINCISMHCLVMYILFPSPLAYLIKSGHRQSCLQSASFVRVLSVCVGEERSTAAVLHRPRMPHRDSGSAL